MPKRKPTAQSNHSADQKVSKKSRTDTQALTTGLSNDELKILNSIAYFQSDFSTSLNLAREGKYFHQNRITVYQFLCRKLMDKIIDVQQAGLMLSMFPPNQALDELLLFRRLVALSVAEKELYADFIRYTMLLPSFIQDFLTVSLKLDDISFHNQIKYLVGRENIFKMTAHQAQRLNCNYAMLRKQLVDAWCAKKTSFTVDCVASTMFEMFDYFLQQLDSISVIRVSAAPCSLLWSIITHQSYDTFNEIMSWLPWRLYNERYELVLMLANYSYGNHLYRSDFNGTEAYFKTLCKGQTYSQTENTFWKVKDSAIYLRNDSHNVYLLRGPTQVELKQQFWALTRNIDNAKLSIKPQMSVVTLTLRK